MSMRRWVLAVGRSRPWPKRTRRNPLPVPVPETNPDPLVHVVAPKPVLHPLIPVRLQRQLPRPIASEVPPVYHHFHHHRPSSTQLPPLLPPPCQAAVAAAGLPQPLLQQHRNQIPNRPPFLPNSLILLVLPRLGSSPHSFALRVWGSTRPLLLRRRPSGTAEDHRA